MTPGDRLYLVNWGISGMTRPFLLKESALDQLKDKPEHLTRGAMLVTLEVVAVEFPVEQGCAETLRPEAPDPFSDVAMRQTLETLTEKT